MRPDQTTTTQGTGTASTSAGAWILSQDDGAWFDAVPGEAMRIRVRGTDVGGRYTIVESISQPLAGPPLHSHHEDEVICVHEGVLTFVVNGARLEAGPGSIVVIPGGAEHAWRNFGSQPARYIAVFTPGGIDELLAQVGKVTPQELPALAARYGSVVTGPPIAR
ncbi:quercetin dioxygenase-like cupin family protein [Bradyrhizobium sp. USDA 4369]